MFVDHIRWALGWWQALTAPLTPRESEALGVRSEKSAGVSLERSLSSHRRLCVAGHSKCRRKVEIEGFKYTTSWTREELYLTARGRLEWLMSTVLKVSYQEAIGSLHEKVGPSAASGVSLGSMEEPSGVTQRGSQNAAPFRPPAGVRNRTSSAPVFRPRLGKCGWKGNGGLDCRRFGPQDLV